MSKQLYFIYNMECLVCLCFVVVDVCRIQKLLFLLFFKKSDHCQAEGYSECNYGIHYKQVSCMISIWLIRTVGTAVTVDV